MNPDHKQLVTQREAARRLKCSTDTIAKYLRIGWLRGTKPGPGRTSPVLVFEESIEERIQGGRRGPYEMRSPEDQE